MTHSPALPVASDDADVHGENDAQRRIDVRNNIFVVAALTTDQLAAPVRIRNISPGGALVEGALLPPGGSRLCLKRGSLGVSGEVIWCEGNKAGIRFDSSVRVADWLPRADRSVDRQQRIDEVVHTYKQAVVAPGGKPGAGATGPVEAASELGALRASLAGIAEDLARDPEIAERHADAVQTIELAAQKLEAIAKLLEQR